MARRDASPLQIIRKDGKNCFVEALNDAFEIGRVHLRFITYNKNAAQGSRFTNDIDIYIDFEDYFRISYDFIKGNIWQKLLSIKNMPNSWDRELTICQGGRSAQSLAASGKPRPDGMGLARLFKMFAGEKYPIMFKAEMGPGQADSNGLIVPKYGRSPESYVQIGLTFDDAKEFFLTIDEHLSAFINAKMYAMKYETRIQKLEAENKLMKNILVEISKVMNINIDNFVREYDDSCKKADEYGKPKFSTTNQPANQSYQKTQQYGNAQQSNNNYNNQGNYQQQSYHPQNQQMNNGYQNQNNYNNQRNNNQQNQGYQQAQNQPAPDFMNPPESYFSENDFFG